MLGQQVGLGYGGQGQVAGHVPAQLPVPPLQEPHGHRHGQHHDGGTAVVLWRERVFRLQGSDPLSHSVV